MIHLKLFLLQSQPVGKNYFVFKVSPAIEHVMMKHGPMSAADHSTLSKALYRLKSSGGVV